MKRFMPYIRSFLFIVGLFIIISVCDYLFAQSGYVRFIVHEMNNKDVNYDTVILGASHARSAIDPQYIDIQNGTNAINIAIPGATVEDSYFELKQACESNKVKTAILDVDYQYWMEKQSQNHFSKSFIYQQFTNPLLKMDYIWNEKEYLDIRNVFCNRLSWNTSIAGIKDNVEIKTSDAYKNYTVEGAAGKKKYVEGADGPYIGRGFFSRITSGGLPGGQKYMESWMGRENGNIDLVTLEYFEKLVKYCNKNDIKLICITSPITPSAMEKLRMGVVHDKLKAVFDSYNVPYYDFNKALQSVIPRDDVDYGDLEGHMGGAIAATYSEVLGKLLKDVNDGTYKESDYFYSSFDELYKNLKTDYNMYSGKVWGGY